MKEQRQLHWVAIALSTGIIVVLSLVFNSLVTILYGLYVGFQTRGDNEAITQQVGQFTHSTLFLILSSIVIGLLIFWRGRAFARANTQPHLLHILIVLGAAVVLGFLIGMVAGEIPPGTLISQSLVQLAVGIAAGYASGAASTTKPTTA